MMGRQSGQMSMVILDLSELIPENHLLRKINQIISFDFIYDIVAPYYPSNGRPSVDCLVYNKNTQNCRGDSPKLQKEIPQ